MTDAPVDPVATQMEIEVLMVELGSATVKMVVAPGNVNIFGVCHGGVLFTLADTAMQWASNSHGIDGPRDRRFDRVCRARAPR